MSRPSDLGLYLIADPEHAMCDLISTVDEALAGGVTAVQLRAKSLTDRQRVSLGMRLRDITSRHGAPLLVNDRLDIALAIGADGVHLGVTDLSPVDARRIAPPGFLIGYSPDDPNDRAGDGVADYLGIGPVYGTTSKADAGGALGLPEFRARVSTARVPVIGIGGIDTSNAADVVSVGAVGVAVISAILRAPDPSSAARSLRAVIEPSR